MWIVCVLVASPYYQYKHLGLIWHIGISMRAWHRQTWLFNVGLLLQSGTVPMFQVSEKFLTTVHSLYLRLSPPGTAPFHTTEQWYA
jgi:hypothetical protein